MIFPLVNTAQVSIEFLTTDRTGQQKKSWGSTITIQCLWSPSSGKEQLDPRDEFVQMGQLYVDDSAVITVGCRVTNITDSNGNIVEPGPYLVKSVKNYFNFSGTLNHRTCGLGGRK